MQTRRGQPDASASTENNGSEAVDFEFDDGAKQPKRDEGFAPVPQPSLRSNASSVAVGRTLPASLEAEEYLLSCCLLDGADIIQRCIDAKIEPESFYETKHGTVYERLLKLFAAKTPIDVSILAEDLKTAKLLDQVGGYPFLTQISSRIPTTAQASYFIDKVREQALLREIIRSATRAVEDCYNFTGDITGFAAEVEAKITDVTRRALGEISSAVKPITAFDYPTADDPNVLLGSDDYLGRGGGMLFVSHAGAGKSSFILDAVMSWGLGKPWMGIRCSKPLVTLVVQAEDSDRYLGKLRRSFAHAHKLTEAEEATLGANVIVARVKGKSGVAFFAELRRLVKKYKPDLVVINPIYLYAEGDISRSEYAQPFLVALDDLNRDEQFGYILVHHTGKPQAKDSKGKRAELEDWETIYMGFGSSYLANWPRCSALLEPRQGTKSRYWLKLGKGGMNAGVTREVEQGAGTRTEAVTKIAIRHSADRMDVAGRERAVIYWEEDEDTASDAEKKAANAEKKGRPKKDRPWSLYSKILTAKAGGEAKRVSKNQLFRFAKESDIELGDNKIGKATFMELLAEWMRDGTVIESDDGMVYVRV